MENFGWGFFVSEEKTVPNNFKLSIVGPVLNTYSKFETGFDSLMSTIEFPKVNL
mgnify:CR=1 FL=1